jgi:stearoyl-CoA desaturase (delta-9 desaturase)
MLVTGIDPKVWVCMHRLHHQHSDTPLDPHSPAHTGFWYTFIKQHKSFVVHALEKRIKIITINFQRRPSFPSKEESLIQVMGYSNL